MKTSTTSARKKRAFSHTVTEDRAMIERVAAWWRHHLYSAIDSLQRLVLLPISSLLTWMVIGVALALPAILYITLTNIEDIGSRWNNGTYISVFLDNRLDQEQGQKIVQKLLKQKEILRAEYISKNDAMKFFKNNSGLGDALINIDENPFPASIELQYLESTSPAQVKQLITKLRKQSGIQSVQLDMDWVQRLYRFMQLGKRLTLVLICLLSLGVLLVVGNTIRLAIENRREEIVVVKLVGGTDAFVRRPFLYSGFWYGLGGGLVAWLTLVITRYFLAEPVTKLMSLYGSDFMLLSLTVTDTLGLIFCGILLGWLGSWLAVSHHLSEIEPS